jgi:starvation-inducible DNA-binding protein
VADAVIEALNQTLVCTIDLRSQVKHASWNVKGNAFVQLHVLFDAIAIELDAHTELLVDRIIVLGERVQGTVRTVATQSTLEDAATANVYTDVSREIETRLSFLDTYLHQ